MAKNPYKPGVGTIPPYLAGRDPQIKRFGKLLENYPEKRNNLRITGLRGVGKTVLLKEFERLAKKEGWVVVRRDLSARMSVEKDFQKAIAEYLRLAVEELSPLQKVKNRTTEALKAIGQITVAAEGVSVAVGAGGGGRDLVLEDRLTKVNNTILKITVNLANNTNFAAAQAVLQANRYGNAELICGRTVKEDLTKHNALGTPVRVPLTVIDGLV